MKNWIWGSLRFYASPWPAHASDDIQALAGSGNADIEQIAVQVGLHEILPIRVIEDHVGELSHIAFGESRLQH